MSTITLNGQCALVKASQANTHFTPAANQSIGDGDYIIVTFPSTSVPAASRKKKIYSETLHVREARTSGGNPKWPGWLYTNAGIDINTVTYNDIALGYPAIHFMNIGYLDTVYDYSTDDYLQFQQGYGVAIARNAYYGDPTIITSGANRPIVVCVLDDSVIAHFSIYNPQPANNGYALRGKANTFRWSSRLDEYCFASINNDVNQASADFVWKAAGDTEEHVVSVTTEHEVTIPANTFPAGGIVWQIRATSNEGETASSEWLTARTDEPLPTCTVTSPNQIVVDGTSDINLKWNYSISTGSAPTDADIRYSYDGSTWTEISSIGGVTAYTLPAGTWHSGSVYWGVRGYNQDGNPGNWSTSAFVTVVAAPAAPSVASTSDPKPTITWQSDEQQAAEVMVDGVSSGVLFGTGKEYRWPHFLMDGSHVVSVRVQNEYAYWSPWSSLQFTVSHQSGDGVTLDVTATSVGYLSATGTGYDGYVWYRDGVEIGESTDATFTDIKAAAGEHTYFVRGLFGTDGYDISAEVSATIRVDGVLLYDKSTGQWIECVTALSGQIGISRQMSVVSAMVSYSGRGYPTAEIGSARTSVYTFRPAFPKARLDEARAFERLLGKPIFLKDPRGNAFDAVITDMNAESMPYGVSYDVTVQRVS